MGSASIDLSLRNIWESWFRYRRGKKVSRELLEFQYYLEENLFCLFLDLQKGIYQHGGYKTFVVSDNKRREISVANIRDRVVHRLLYDYLNGQYDKTFIYDAWSCRSGKGLTAAIERVQKFFRVHPQSFVWRGDVQKFFDSVDHAALLHILGQRVKDVQTFHLIQKVIRSFSKNILGKGMPIGNLTSQIFANIYLNEFDRFIKHELKSKAYLRYGDDFILLDSNRESLLEYRNKSIIFLQENLKLSINIKNDSVRKVRQGLNFLGIVMYPRGRKLNRRNHARIRQRLSVNNAGSYFGLVSKHENPKRIKEFYWNLFERISLQK